MKRVFQNKYLQLLLFALLAVGLLCVGCTDSDLLDNGAAPSEAVTIAEDGVYTAPQDVADYLHEYGHLPDNFITKKEAQALGWDNKEGNLDEVAPGMSIGGDYFGNREGLLPKADQRKYYECDVNYTGGYRNGERIVYSNDGLIYYSDDHYKSYEQLY